jgi:hypothetical protein
MFFFRQLLLFMVPVALILLTNRANADNASAVATGVLANRSLYSESYRAAGRIDLQKTVAAPSSAEDERTARIITGGVLIMGGGALYCAGHLLAFRTYNDYKRSAFTEYTDPLRRRLLAFNGMRVGGGVLAGIGGIYLAVSF